MLLHNVNKFPSVPIAYATNMKETYENLKILLEKLNVVVSCANGTAGTEKSLHQKE